MENNVSSLPKISPVLKRVLIAGLLILVVVFGLFVIETVQIFYATKSYNAVVLEYNQLSQKYEATTKESCIDNIE